MIVPARRRSRGAVIVPAADGYHFGDDHPWGSDEQNSLIDMVKMVRKKFIDTQEEPAQEAQAARIEE